MTANRMRARPANRYHRLLIPRLGAGDYLRLVEEEELAGGGRAKKKKEPLPLRYSRFVRAIELHGMARDDMGNQSFITHLVISQYRPRLVPRLVFASRRSSRSRYLSSRSSSRLLVSLLRLVSSHAVASRRAVIISIIYHDHLAHQLIVLSLPFPILPHRRIASSPHRHLVPALMGENELNKTARFSVSSNGTPISTNRHRPIGFYDGATGKRHAATRQGQDEPPLIIMSMRRNERDDTRTEENETGDRESTTRSASRRDEPPSEKREHGLLDKTPGETRRNDKPSKTRHRKTTSRTKEQETDR